MVQLRKDDHWLDAEIYAMAVTRLPHIAPLLVRDVRKTTRKTLSEMAAEVHVNRREPIRRRSE